MGYRIIEQSRAISCFKNLDAMKTLLITILLLASSAFVIAQKYKSVESEISFYSEAPVEDISANNKKASSIVDLGEQAFAFAVPIQSFQFRKSLMQKHFNEKYLESDKFPKSTFTGKIEGYQAGLEKQDVVAAGELTIHGVTKKVELPGTIEISGNGFIIKSNFIVKLEDYDIKIPSVLWQNIAEEIEVTINFSYSPYEID